MNFLIICHINTHTNKIKYIKNLCVSNEYSFKDTQYIVKQNPCQENNTNNSHFNLVFSQNDKKSNKNSIIMRIISHYDTVLFYILLIFYTMSLYLVLKPQRPL